MRKSIFWVLLFALVSPVFATHLCEQQHCLAIVDVGSTGSRLHIYSYDIENNFPVNINERWANKIKPGFANLEDNQEVIDKYLNQLFVNAPDYQIPLYFYATAGMRLIPQPRQQQMYLHVTNWFSRQDQWQLAEAKTISGSDEGLYGWLAVNYQRNGLSNLKDTVGVMDMGGASVQIVFPLQNSEGVSKQDLRTVSLQGQDLKLFVHSFLGLGQNEVTHQFLDDDVCFANNYQLSTEEAATGDAYTCEKNITNLLNDVHEVNNLVQPILADNKVAKWYTIGGVTDLVKSEPFNFSQGTFNATDLLTIAQSAICQQDWNTILNQYSSNEYIYGYCLFPAYYYALIVDGYGITANETLYYPQTNQSTDWTIGVLLSKKTYEKSDFSRQNN